MRVALSSIVVAVVISVVVGYALFAREKPIYEALAQPGVRIGDPGTNLVGPNWSGLYPAPTAPTAVRDARHGGL
jgi:hypothetical protein